MNELIKEIKDFLIEIVDYCKDNPQEAEKYLFFIAKHYIDKLKNMTCDNCEYNKSCEKVIRINQMTQYPKLTYCSEWRQK